MLKTQALTKMFGATRAVNSVDLTVEPGELVCLLGPSGCGKSTLLRMIAGLTTSDEGSIRIAGADMTDEPANRRPTAMVFQSHALWTHMSVERNVAFGLRVRGLPRAEIREKVAAALDLVGLKGYETRLPSQLSGGQAQRVSIARCLVVEPKMLLMDEPFSALDAHLRQHLREELKLIQKRLGLTILFVTHDQEEAMEIADRIAVMSAGRIEQIGRPGELYAEPATRFVAGFIGQMNMSVARIASGLLHWHGSRLPTDLPDGDYTAAVRPEDLLPVVQGGIRVRLDRALDLGSVCRMHVTTDDGTTLKLQHATLLKPGDGVVAPDGTLWVEPRIMRLYRDDILAGTLRPTAARTDDGTTPAPKHLLA